MKLRSLEISGFKSFADKTKIEFKDGMTGIVGPNGSGKSNIIEAIRWVMGEQSAKGLRGEKMQDVIFGGTTKRKALSRAQVTITLDNSDQYLKSEFTEINITRRLYRSGESNYLINGQDVRLKDIVELFMDTGLGRESFSIISQGRVEEVFNSKPEDRRTIIEEVAGVYKYKQNKEHAQKELKQTKENLDRVEDILQEVKNRLEPLNKQASIAKNYLVQKKQYDTLEKSRLVIEINDYLSKNNQLEANITSLNGIVNQQQQEINEENSKLKLLKKSQVEDENQRETLQGSLLSLAENKERLNGLQNITAEREQNRTTTILELKNNLNHGKTDILALQKDISVKYTDFNTKKAAINVVKGELNNLTQQNDVNNITVIQNKILKLEHSHLENVKLQITLQTELQNSDNSLNQVTNGGSDLDNKLKEEITNLNRVKSELDVLKDKLSNALNKKQNATNELKEVTNLYQSINLSHKKSQQSWFNGLGLVKQAQARLESLQHLQDQYGGYYQGVKNLMQQKNKFIGVHGVVADVIKVPNNLSKAIETALGSALQQVVVKDQQIAKDAVKYLTTNRLGRVTFLPIDIIKPRKLSTDQISKVKQLNGYVGLASELVKTDDKFKNIVDYLLGSTIISESLNKATEISKFMQHRVKVVTLDGQIINPGGSITGGAQKNDNYGILQQKTEIDELIRSIDVMNNKLVDDEKIVKNYADDLDSLTEKGTNKRVSVANINEEIQILKNKIELTNDNYNRVEEQIKKFKNEQSVYDNSVNVYQENKIFNKRKLAELTNTLKKEEQQLADYKEKLAVINQDNNILSEQIYEKREWLAANNATLGALNNQLQELDRQKKALENKQDQMQSRLDLLNSDGDDLVSAKLRAKEDLKLVEKKYDAAKNSLDDVKLKLSTILLKITDVERKLTKMQQKQQLAIDELSDLKAKNAKVSTLLEQAQNKLEHDYNLNLTDAKLELVELPIEEIKTKLKLIKMGLDEIGNVNLGSINEYEEVLERHEFLTRQRDDLLSARDNLFGTMTEMDDEVKIRFEATFKSVAVEFSRIFVQMFGGGKAELTLTNPDDLLTSGIDIMAQPPGKKFQQMSLLSGGEKALTAITLLFSILAVRPVPFAILDETEAALDDANVTRFANYLSNFENKTQFIVITHRKGTMVNADVLYGITMQESGISKMVSVNLADIK